jgi:hypothetical protein
MGHEWIFLGGIQEYGRYSEAKGLKKAAELLKKVLGSICTQE